MEKFARPRIKTSRHDVDFKLYLEALKLAFKQKLVHFNNIVPTVLKEKDINFEQEAQLRYPVGYSSIQWIEIELDNWTCYTIDEYKRLCFRYTEGWRHLYQKITNKNMQELFHER